MNRNFRALALAGALTLTLLTGCGQPAATPPASPSPTVTAYPIPSPAPEDAATPAPTDLPPADPSESVTVSPEPADPSASPGATEVIRPGGGSAPAQPPETPAPAPTPTPDPAPTESAQPEVSVVQSVWNKVSGYDRPELMDIDSGLLSDLYGISSDDVVEFIGKMPMMSAHVNEFLIVQAAPGKADSIKAACETRLETLKAGGLYPSSLELVDNYKLIVNGDYVLFCIDDYADEMADAFNSYTK